MCGSNYEFGLPANVKDRLLLLVGKEIPLIQNASEAFSSCLSLIDRLVCTLLSAPEQCPACLHPQSYFEVPRGNPQHPLPARFLRAFPPLPRPRLPPYRRLAAPRRLRSGPRGLLASPPVRRPRRLPRIPRNARGSQSGAHQLDHPPEIGLISPAPDHALAVVRAAHGAVREHRLRSDRAAGAGLHEVLLSHRRLCRTDRVFVVSAVLSGLVGIAELPQLSAGGEGRVSLRNTVPCGEYRALRRRDGADRQI